jgi:excisionase family DNA binding protein
MCVEETKSELEAVPELMQVREAAAWLGMSASTLYGALKRGEIPVKQFTIGRTLWLSRRQLETWLEGGEVHARLKAERRTLRRAVAPSFESADDFDCSA